VAYLVGNARIFGKRSDGSRRWESTAALLPYLHFARIVWLTQVTLSSEPATSSVNEHLTVSRRLRPHELPADTVQICDLTCEFVDPEAFRSRYAYICHPILDASATDAAEILRFAKSLIPPKEGTLLVHCANGHGRPGMFAAVWLLAHGYATSADEALKLIRKVRPGVSLRRRQYQLVEDVATLLSRPVEPADARSVAAVGAAVGETHMPPPA
jgi:protein-tyrosine phosphatase